MSERKSNKQRRAEIRDKRLKRAEAARRALAQPDPRWRDEAGPPPVVGGVATDRELLARYNNTYDLLPAFYFDRPFTCRDCGEAQVWTAKQQKWWYEEVRAPIDSEAVRCRRCRRARREGDPAGNALRERCRQLRALGARAPDAAARRAIDEALESKWWGVRVVALETLGLWADATSVERLKAMVSPAQAPPRGSWLFQARSAAAKALALKLPEAESDWALETGLSGHREGGHLLEALVNRPRAFWERALETEWRRADPERLIRLVWAVRWNAADEALYRSWRGKLRGHADRRVGLAVRYAWGEET
ncbi:hypothetical protein FKV24_009060 [Lysobacter maris]|uniref:Probable zinc-binding domain-containing protein n=1 Tax=Marilutibacter maris TaxID=1605891 RepID=A0A508AQU6_9GAMM|nr:zinc-ribbon domain containing protein [Lysobacter maris]KAB8189697.1 hypothetical protein FKV24_009060 [Lysobacter maris]